MSAKVVGTKPLVDGVVDYCKGWVKYLDARGVPVGLDIYKDEYSDAQYIRGLQRAAERVGAWCVLHSILEGERSGEFPIIVARPISVSHDPETVEDILAPIPMDNADLNSIGLRIDAVAVDLVIYYLAEQGLYKQGDRVCVLGKSPYVGGPVARMVASRWSHDVMVCDSRVSDHQRMLACLSSQLVINCTGGPGNVEPKWLGANTTLIELSGRRKDRSQFSNNRNLVDGVGPLTCALTIKNAIDRIVDKAGL